MVEVLNPLPELVQLIFRRLLAGVSLGELFGDVRHGGRGSSRGSLGIRRAFSLVCQFGVFLFHLLFHPRRRVLQLGDAPRRPRPALALGRLVPLEFGDAPFEIVRPVLRASSRGFLLGDCALGGGLGRLDSLQLGAEVSNLGFERFHRLDPVGVGFLEFVLRLGRGGDGLLGGAPVFVNLGPQRLHDLLGTLALELHQTTRLVRLLEPFGDRLQLSPELGHGGFGRLQLGAQGVQFFARMARVIGWLRVNLRVLRLRILQFGFEGFNLSLQFGLDGFNLSLEPFSLHPRSLHLRLVLGLDRRQRCGGVGFGIVGVRRQLCPRLLRVCSYLG